MLDVLIITYNEQMNLPHCLEALRGWTRTIFVVDSGSTDRTQAIAESYGARVVEQPWLGYARQRNWALETLPFEADWVLILDADEIITPSLRQKIEAIAEQPAGQVPENGFFINRLTYFLDQPIRHCGYYPSWNLRLMKRGAGRYENRRVHEHMIIENPVSYIRDPMLHWDRRGLEHAFAKHNRYSSLEAQQLAEELNQAHPNPASANLTTDARRRRWLKRYVAHRMPFLAFWRFVYMYIFRLGLLDGRAGLDFCRFIATYDAMVAMKLRWLLRGSASAIPTPVETPALAVPADEQSHAAEADDGSGSGSGSKPQAQKAAARAPAATSASSGGGHDEPRYATTRPNDSPAGGATGGGGSNGDGSHRPDSEDRQNETTDDRTAPSREPSEPGELDTELEADHPVQHRPQASPWSLREKLGRGLWMVFGRPCFRLTFHNWYALRRGLLRLFGARIGPGVAIRPTVNIEVPWMLEVDEQATIGDYAILYSLGKIYIGKRTIVSQYAHLCAGTHDHTDRHFPLLREPIHVGSDVWIGADAFVGPGVRIGNLSVLGARSSAFKDLPPRKTCVGSPAKPIKDRILR